MIPVTLLSVLIVTHLPISHLDLFLIIKKQSNILKKERFVIIEVRV